MLDRRWVADHTDEVIENCRRRGLPESLLAEVGRFASLDADRRRLKGEIDGLNQQAGQVSRSIGKAASDEEREGRKAEGRQLREQISALEAASNEVVAAGDAILRAIPNLTHPDAPVGTDETASQELRRRQHAPPTFSFPPADHVTLAERLQLLNDQFGVYRCHTTFNCTDACPRGIEVTKAIAEVKRAMITRSF